MANSFDVNINLTSNFGFKSIESYVLRPNIPQIQTVKTLDDATFTTATYTIAAGPIMSIAPLEDFIVPLNTTSNIQTMYISNVGYTAMTITDILFSYNTDIGPRFYFSSSTTLVNSSTITILPNNTATIGIAYRGAMVGVYDSYLIVRSNSITGLDYRINTHQVVQSSQEFIISPTGFDTTVSLIGENVATTYTVTPILNTIVSPDVIVPVSGTLTGSPAWSIIGTGNNTISVNFNPNEINNVNGTYISTLTIDVSGSLHEVTNTATVNIDYSKNIHLNSWLSPASHYNSIIGVSYDLVDDIRYLTIGVGMGGDGSPIYGNGGSVYANTDNLGLGVNTVVNPYPFWANVYRIPFTGAAQTYTSNDYIVKTTEGVDYSGYFGEHGESGTMFIVEDDGYGSLTIELNHLRELSDDPEVNATLQNLTRAFHYYSDVDIEGRYEPLPPEYASTIDDVTTYLFVGFNYNTRDKLAFVNTSIVPLPV